LNYAFEAVIDREIEKNDGKEIVEVRHFRDLRSLKVETRLEDVRIHLGPAGDFLAKALALIQPEGTPNATGIVSALDGVSMKGMRSSLRWSGIAPEKLLGMDDKALKAFVMVDNLSGKSVRLTYVDGNGVVQLQPVKGAMTQQERDFHIASVLCSDSLIVP